MASDHDKSQLAERAIAVLEERGVESRCPRCRKDQWIAETIGLLAAPLPVTSLSAPPPHIETILLTCSNCGFSSMHNLRVLEVE